MKRGAAENLKDALALPTEALAALAGSLLESLDIEVDEDAEAAWAIEVNRRVAELDSGAVNADHRSGDQRYVAYSMAPKPRARDLLFGLWKHIPASPRRASVLTTIAGGGMKCDGC
jgi:hypothetical protein